MQVIGIDPGSRKTGWGIVADESGSLRLLDCGIIRAESVAKATFSERLAYIYNEICSRLSGMKLDCAAIEQVFTACNPQTALKLGQARGVAVAACAAYGLPIHDYEPNLVKKSLVGAGRAEKEQVAFMVGRLLNIREVKLPLDTTDALAVAICHLGQARYQAFASRIGQQGPGSRIPYAGNRGIQPPRG